VCCQHGVSSPAAIADRGTAVPAWRMRCLLGYTAYLTAQSQTPWIQHVNLSAQGVYCHWHVAPTVYGSELSHACSMEGCVLCAQHLVSSQDS